jgi:hypothetical protein
MLVSLVLWSGTEDGLGTCHFDWGLGSFLLSVVVLKYFCDVLYLGEDYALACEALMSRLPL